MDNNQEVKVFIAPHYRNPSHHNPEDRFKYRNWLKHNKRLLYGGEKKAHCFAIANGKYQQRAAPNGGQPFVRMGKQDAGLAGIDYIVLAEMSPDDLLYDLQGF